MSDAPASVPARPAGPLAAGEMLIREPGRYRFTLWPRAAFDALPAAAPERSAAWELPDGQILTLEQLEGLEAFDAELAAEWRALLEKSRAMSQRD